jgi:23S rRNA A2030 N6-methylase RlmJ
MRRSDEQRGGRVDIYKILYRSIASQSLPFRKGIEHLSLNIIQHVQFIQFIQHIQHIQYFHQYSFAIGSSILEIRHSKSHDRFSSKIPWITDKSSSGS